MQIKVNDELKRTLLIAKNCAIENCNPGVGTEHVLYGMLKNENTAVSKLLIEYGLKASIMEMYFRSESRRLLGEPNFTDRVNNIIIEAYRLDISMGKEAATNEQLLHCMLVDTANTAVSLMAGQCRIDVRSLLSSVDALLTKNNLTPDVANETLPEKLRDLGEDITQKAKMRKIDPVIGRNEEIERIIQILCRKTKNNPVLIGEPGVGKSAVVEGLARKIVSGDVPELLRNKTIFSLDIGSIIAGTKYRGAMEEKLKDAIAAIKESNNIIVFIDELHTLAQAGGKEGEVSPADILKPYLARGELQTIGATTTDEYRKYIETDKALERRFQPVVVAPPSVEQTIEILKGLKENYEAFHKVTLSDEAIEAAAKLSDRYITDRFLPDKAIDLLDEACTCANLRNKAISDYELFLKKRDELKSEEEELTSKAETTTEDAERDKVYKDLATVKTELLSYDGKEDELKEKASHNDVKEEDLAKVINLWTGIPVTKVMEGDIKRLAGLEDRLKAHLIGQDEAVDLVVAAIKRNRVQLSVQRRPASFIFVGPTGVGKTELVKLLSKELFDTPETLIRLDMSEFMEKHSVSRLIGSPPGYVGYDEAGQLTEKVRRKPYSIILFDEIEKAHPDVMNILLQILDEGKTNDAHGRTVSFANTVIIMTSNAGSERRESALGFAKAPSDIKKENAIKGLREFLRPEFIGRVDEIVVFNELTEDNYKDIAKLMLSELSDSLKEKSISFGYSDDVPALLVSKMDGTVRGARDLRNVIRRNVEDKISNYLVDNYDKPLKAINLSADGDEVILETK